MADIKFSALPKATTSKDGDELAILQDGENKMIPSPVLESKIINKTVTRVIDQGGASLNVVNLKGVVPTYAYLALITPTPEINDAYQVEADGLVYVYTETGFQADGEGFKVQPEPTGVVEEGNPNAVSGGEVWGKQTLAFNFFSKKGFLIRKTDGQEQANADYFCTGFIKIDLNKDIIVMASNSTAGTPIAFYDKDFNHISSVSEPSIRHGMFTVNKEDIPVNSTYIRSGYNVLGLEEGLIIQGFAYDAKDLIIDTKFNLEGYIHKDTGVFVSNDTYISTELYKIDKKYPMNVNVYKSKTFVGGVYFYDVNFKYISSLYDGTSDNIVESNVDIPTNAVYYRATALKTQYYYVKNNNEEEAINRVNNNGSVKAGNLFTLEGYLRHDLGNFIASSDYYSTDFLPLDYTQAIRIKCSGSGFLASPYVFYDENKEQVFNGFTGSVEAVEKTILPEEFPEGARYIRLSQRIEEISDPYIYGITMNAVYNELKSVENKNNSIKVLNIGSSHGIDMIQSFPILALKSGINVRVANLYSSGIRLPAVLDKCINNEDFEWYSKNEDGSKWNKITTGVGERTVSKALKEEKWDVIILQRGAYGTNEWTALQQDALFGIIKYIYENTDYSPKILFSLGHPPAVGNASTPTLQDQNQWYLDSVAGVLEMQKNVYLDIIPTGTAVQNARSTFLKNYGTGENQDLCRDLLHLDTGIGTYITGCLLFEYIIGKRFDLSILTNKYIPKLTDINGILGSASTYTEPTQQMAEAARYCVMAAIQNPYEVSENLAVNFENE